MTDMASDTKIIPTDNKANGCLSSIAIIASNEPSPSDPVSPINTYAG
jgi:hypothetical protein